MTDAPILIWLRRDLRLDDNPALHLAAERNRPVVCLYVHDDVNTGTHGLGSAQNWWLHQSLKAFGEQLEKIGGALVLRRGDARTIVREVANEINAEEVVWTRRYMDWEVALDKAIKSDIESDGRTVQSVNGSLLSEPWSVKTKSDTFYRVFSPYWRQVQALQDQLIRPALPKVTKLSAPDSLPPSDELEDWALTPTRPNWATGIAAAWTPGEDGARDRWQTFLARHAGDYDAHRNRPDLDETTRLSPHLHFGEISPIRLWHDMRAAMADGRVSDKQGMKFLSEVVWREFSYQLIYHHPSMHTAPLQENFAAFGWSDDAEGWRAWTKGLTGYPIVDAGMRQLWQEGWMHNRVRMIVGSFLVKDLLIDWRDGMAWFWDTLVDADPANNTASWQWIAGCGADAAPYFRVFNPTSQGEKFDPNGDYVRKYVPELAHLPAKCIHDPSSAPALVLEEAGVQLGETYPHPIVDHAMRRKEALARYEKIKAAKT